MLKDTPNRDANNSQCKSMIHWYASEYLGAFQEPLCWFLITPFCLGRCGIEVIGVRKSKKKLGIS